MPRRSVVPLVVAVLGLGVMLSAVAPAHAARDGWADLRFSGEPNRYFGTMTQQPTGFPRAHFVSDSAAGSVGRQSGASTFLPASSAVGQLYGSSRNRPYLNLRPNTQNGSGVPGISTTTYTFERPTPATGWTFVLGDIDADQVTITGTDRDRRAVDPSDFGFRSAFNYSRRNGDVPRGIQPPGFFVVTRKPMTRWAHPPGSNRLLR